MSMYQFESSKGSSRGGATFFSNQGGCARGAGALEAANDCGVHRRTVGSMMELRLARTGTGTTPEEMATTVAAEMVAPVGAERTAPAGTEQDRTAMGAEERRTEVAKGFADSDRTDIQMSASRGNRLAHNRHRDHGSTHNHREDREKVEVSKEVRMDRVGKYLSREQFGNEVQVQKYGLPLSGEETVIGRRWEEGFERK